MIRLYGEQPSHATPDFSPCETLSKSQTENVMLKRETNPSSSLPSSSSFTSSSPLSSSESTQRVRWCDHDDLDSDLDLYHSCEHCSVEFQKSPLPVTCYPFLYKDAEPANQLSTCVNRCSCSVILRSKSSFKFNQNFAGRSSLYQGFLPDFSL